MERFTKDTVTKITFNDEATMNAWFSAGGEIRVSMSHNDTSNDQQGTSWEQLTTEMGTYRISLRDTDTTTVADSVRKKYSDLTTSYAEIKKEYADASDIVLTMHLSKHIKMVLTFMLKTTLKMHTWQQVVLVLDMEAMVLDRCMTKFWYYNSNSFIIKVI